MKPVQFLVPGFAFVLLGIPIIEIALFVVIGGAIGVLGTILAVIATGVLGTAVLSYQGTATLQRLNRNLEAGELPVREVFDGFLMLIAALLLITPGFATDAIGFSLTVPFVRGAIASVLRDRARVYTARSGQSPDREYGRDDGLVIEGELVEPPDPNPNASRTAAGDSPGARR